MRIAKLQVKNFRSLVCLPATGWLELSLVHCLIGKNDAGKSSIILALNAFFTDKVTQDDLSKSTEGNPESVQIAIGWTELPESIELLESAVTTSLGEELLLASDGTLCLSKQITPSQRGSKAKAKIVYQITAVDYVNPDFQNLCDKKERDLNTIGTNLGLTMPRSGAGNTNKERRRLIRESLDSRSEPKGEVVYDLSSDLFGKLAQLFPAFMFFPADQSLDTQASAFQSQFKPIVKKLLDDNSASKDTLEQGISAGLTNEFERIHQKLQQHITDINSLAPEPAYDWEKGISFRLITGDIFGLQNIPIENRGAGIRRLLMVAYLQYLAERDLGENNYIFAIEEPEVYLHPGAQRDLLTSLRELQELGNQVVFTTHSPVFAGMVEPNGIWLIQKPEKETFIRTVANFATVRLFVEMIAEELGIRVDDALVLKKAVIFVEGKEDVDYLRALDAILVSAGVFDQSLEDAGFALVMIGGRQNMDHWVARGLLSELNKKYAVIIDSDREVANAPLDEKLIFWKQSCEDEGAQFHVLRYSELESYLNPDAVKRMNSNVNVSIPTYKGVGGDKVKRQVNVEFNSKLGRFDILALFAGMTMDEIKDRCKYTDEQGIERFEIPEILAALRELLNSD